MNTVEPIRDKKQIVAMKKILRGTNMRDYTLFVLGINTGLRVSDLLRLKVEDVFHNARVRDAITIRERKTGKQKRFGLNRSCQEALKEYMAVDPLQPGDYLFYSRKGENKPISRQHAYRILSEAAREVGITDDLIGTHTLRKTFGYHARLNGAPIEVLQKIFNHSAPSITMRYIGITQDELEDVYVNLNL